jgi:hypothetical protein
MNEWNGKLGMNKMKSNERDEVVMNEKWLDRENENDL